MTIRFTDESQPTEDVPPGGPGQRHRPDRPWFRWLSAAVGLAALGGVWMLVLLRWTDVSRPSTIAVVGIMPFLAIGPLVVGLAGAWWSRSATLRSLAALTLGLFLYTTSPVDAVVGCRAADLSGSAADGLITVYTANVLFHPWGGKADEIGGAIAAEGPDVILLQEVTADFLASLEADPRLADYAYRSTDVDELRSFDIVWSRWPLADASVITTSGGSLISATVDGPAGQFQVSPVHFQAPLSEGDVARWRWEHEGLVELDRSSPRILGGDFNATRDHQTFRQVLDAGWTDVHEEKGCGLDTTWPTGGRVPIPLMRLDHVLVTDHFEVLDVRLGNPGGSDHLPVITTLRLSDS